MEYLKMIGTDYYYESAEDITISKARAIQELRKHGHRSKDESGIYQDSIESFLEDVGDLDQYNAQTVLTWLGY